MECLANTKLPIRHALTPSGNSLQEANDCQLSCTSASAELLYSLKSAADKERTRYSHGEQRVTTMEAHRVADGQCITMTQRATNEMENSGMV